MICGHSGCKIEFSNQKVKKIAEKYSVNRLYKQAYKQNWFSTRLNNVPPVTKIEKNYFEMEYYMHIDIISLFSKFDFRKS